MRIYTKGGDKGTTGIFGGNRVDKDDIRIEANGTLDELNATLGVIRALMDEQDGRQEILAYIQRTLMIVMSQVATPSGIREQNENKLPEDIDRYCEQQIDRMNNEMQHPSTHFILPGGTLISAQCHVARTIARRAERRLCTLNKADEVPPLILRFVNRLSDLLFTMARWEMDQQGTEEERWKAFLYKKKNNK
ncbi:MAG TPA: cob(I)yrinic acid a,c-diamide adenosyltransferase [Candidatus Butyricimonas faecavium]|nr:cob(I)yrinic acid a,c-diamide adenosyltransferase [Candidatus Butyricimonas faecavium]